MSMFMAWSAFKGAPAQAIVAEIRSYFSRHGVELKNVPADPYEALEEDTLIYDRGRWVIIRWPEAMLNGDLPLCEDLTRKLRILASTNVVAEDDVWRHALVDRGEVVDIFANRPDYYCETEQQARTMKKRFQGNAETVARALGVDPKIVSPYFVHLGMDRTPKAFPDDEEHLGSPWSFRCFWNRVGIVIPNTGEGCIAGLRPLRDWDDKLPRRSDFQL